MQIRPPHPTPLELVLLALVCFQYPFLMKCLWLVTSQLITEQSTCSGCCLGTLPFPLLCVRVCFCRHGRVIGAK